VSSEPNARIPVDLEAISHRERYQLLTSLVVPRPIGWISTWNDTGTPNLAPFSYFSALAASPMLVGVSIGHRPDGPKDTLVNVRSKRAFCVNVVTEELLEAMNATSASVPYGVDEFDLARLEPAASRRVDAPYVAESPAVLECEVFKEVPLDGAPNTLVIGRVVGMLLDPGLPTLEGTRYVVSEELRPVGRLWGESYAMPGRVRIIPRPR
jgi:flavin reductase (DIM6/NTAB) family NADH-FMN oxidoreductase RutF